MQPLRPVSAGARVFLGAAFFAVFIAAWGAVTYGGLVPPLFLASPGHAAHLSRRELTTGDHEIVVTPEGGTLDLSAPIEPLRIPALFRGGCALRLSRLAEVPGAIVDDRGRTLEVVSPPVEPGPWSLCLVTRGQLESYKGGDPEFPGCVHGVLSAAGKLELSLPGDGPADSP